MTTVERLPTFSAWYQRYTLSGIGEREISGWQQDRLIILVPHGTPRDQRESAIQDYATVCQRDENREWRYSGIHVTIDCGRRIAGVFTTEKGRRVLEAEQQL